MRTHFVPLLIARVGFDNTIITIRRTAVDTPIRPNTVTRQAYHFGKHFFGSVRRFGVIPEIRDFREYSSTLPAFSERCSRAAGQFREKKSSPFRVRGEVVYWSERRRPARCSWGTNAVVMVWE
jgi:hypothetical protein